MARSPNDLRRLAQELAALTPEERASALKEFAGDVRCRPPPADFTPPLLTGGTRWIGGGLHREDQYGDDGR